MGRIGKEVQVTDVNLNPSIASTSKIVVVIVDVREVVKTWGDYMDYTWGSVSNLTW